MKRFTLLLAVFAALSINATADTNKERVVFLGEHTIGKWDWNSYLTIEGSSFGNLASGDKLSIVFESDDETASDAKESYYQYTLVVDDGDSRPQLASGSVESGTTTIEFTPTQEQIDGIKSNRLMIQGHFIKVKKVFYGQANTTSAVSDESKLPYDTGEWDVAALGISLETLRTAKAGDKIVFNISSTYTATGRDYCQAFLQGDGLGIGGSDLKDKSTAEYTLTDANIAAIASTSWAQFVGKGVVVSSINLVTHDYIYVLSSINSNVSLTGISGTVDVELKRSYDWNATLCVPFDIASVTETFGSTAKAYEFKEYNNGLVFVEREHIEAGKPYFMEFGEADKDKTSISVSDVTINATLNNSDESNGLTFKGNYTPGMNMQGNYGVAWKDNTDGWGFYKGGAGSKLNAFSAYFEGSIPSADSRLAVILVDETSGIEDAIKNGEPRANSLFDLQGRKVAQPQKGLYIVNGKKVFINK